MPTSFNPGRFLATPGVVETFSTDFVFQCISRHLNCDWGDVCPEDAQENDFSTEEGFRIVSAYHHPDGKKLWIITEADRSATTALLPEEY